jgi:hypothetical protein
MNKTRFYKLLVKARNDEAALIIVVNKIMPLINGYSLNKNNEIDDDIRSFLIENAIKVIKNKDFADKLASNKKF